MPGWIPQEKDSQQTWNPHSTEVEEGPTGKISGLPGQESRQRGGTGILVKNEGIFAGGTAVTPLSESWS